MVTAHGLPGRFFNNFVSKNQEINYAQPFDWGIVGKKFGGDSN